MKKNINLNERIFIAGASGMVGSSIKRKLILEGYGDITKGGAIFSPSRKELNLLNIEDVKEWFEYQRPTIVIIAAAKVGGILANKNLPFDFILKNLKIQNNLIEVAWKNNIKRLLFLGSSCIYPKFSKQPISEDYLLTGPLEQTNESYAVAKIAGIKLCEALRIQHGFDAISLMPTNLYGPGDNYDDMNSHVMASLIKKFSDAVRKKIPYVTCWGSGTPLREFMYVDDLAEAVLFVLLYWDPNDDNAPKNDDGEKLYYLNVGTGQDISIKELAKKIAKFTNFKGEILWDKNKPDGTPKKLLNVNRLLNLGWSPKVCLNDGIKMTINHYKNKY